MVNQQQQQQQQRPKGMLVKFERNASEVLKRLVKYALEGLAVALAAKYIPNQQLNVQEIVMLGLTAACVFALLDIFAPTVSVSARQGAGFALGANRIAGGFKTA